MNGELIIREAAEKDCDFILSLNEKNVEVLAPMDEARLQAFRRMAELFLVCEVSGVPAAFLLAMRENVTEYESENYRWFKTHYDKFLYVDRIVIDEKYRGKGIGRTLYGQVIRHAKNSGVPFVTAEIDTIPYNEVSLKFHGAMGFREVGTQFVRGGDVKVSLQVLEV